MRPLLIFASLLTAASASEELFTTAVRPILESACVTCHNEEKDKGEIRLDTREAALASISEGEVACLVPEKPEESGLYETVLLDADDDLAMPPDGARLTKIQSDVLKKWITEGAAWPADVTLEAVRRIDFAEQVQPILEMNCVSCHKEGEEEGGWNVVTRKLAFESGDNAPNIVPFSTEKSAVYFLCALEEDDDDLMPPKESGGPLDAADILILRDWIAQGANWPEGITLTQREKIDGAGETPDNLELVKKIHAKIVATSKNEDAAAKAYTGTIPVSGASYEMVPIPAGTFLMGSAQGEANRKEDEGPQREITVAPFWMGKYEVSWPEYGPFQITKVDRFKNGARKVMPENPELTDAVSQPTTPYIEMSFGMGTDGFPAISMTQHAANKYCQWLSAQTGHFYRLPTEAEWEYACRAGTTTPYSFPEGEIDEFAWHYENCDDEKYQKIGTKSPNPWGLYDMHGNVMEWCLDGYEADAYTRPLPESGWVYPETLYPRVVRGGGWDSDPDELRSAHRIPSSESWKREDPQLPKSIWYHTSNLALGFRIVRPVQVPSPEEMFRIWNCGRPPED